MIFTRTPLEGAWLLDLDRHEDDRGWFARAWCRREMEEHGLNPALVQCSMSYNPHRGTLRGMHWQAPPHGEGKLVRCTRGAIWDVIIDLRSGSPTYVCHYGVQLSAENRRAIYIPEQFAHGFVTLAADTEVFYQMTNFYSPESARGVRWDDPAFAIDWPVTDPIMSPRDASYPDFTPERA